MKKKENDVSIEEELPMTLRGKPAVVEKKGRTGRPFLLKICPDF